MKDHPVRRYFSLIDGIVGGEGEGPLAPTPRRKVYLLLDLTPSAQIVLQ